MHLEALGRLSRPGRRLPVDEAAPTQRIALRGWLYIISPERMQGKGWKTGPMGAVNPLAGLMTALDLWHQIELGDHRCVI